MIPKREAKVANCETSFLRFSSGKNVCCCCCCCWCWADAVVLATVLLVVRFRCSGFGTPLDMVKGPTAVGVAVVWKDVDDC